MMGIQTMQYHGSDLAGLDNTLNERPSFVANTIGAVRVEVQVISDKYGNVVPVYIDGFLHDKVRTMCGRQEESAPLPGACGPS
jgi:hypothetical protein